MATQQDLVETMAEDAGISKAAAKRAANSCFGFIKSVLSKGDDISIHGFGTFKMKEVKGRTGRNPSTGEAIEIPTKIKPKCKFSNKF